MMYHALTRRILLAAPLALLPFVAIAAEIDQFFGTFEGSAEGLVNDETDLRDLNTTISGTKDGVRVKWTSVIYKADGRTKDNTYDIEFVPSQRGGLYGSAMQTNIFGKQVPLDPLKGEPYVWARLEGETFSVFSLFIAEEGGYEIQEFHRTLADGGLDLHFIRVKEGAITREVNAFLDRVD